MDIISHNNSTIISDNTTYIFFNEVTANRDIIKLFVITKIYFDIYELSDQLESTDSVEAIFASQEKTYLLLGKKESFNKQSIILIAVNFIKELSAKYPDPNVFHFSARRRIKGLT